MSSVVGEPEGFPDPVLTANIYCSGGLDAVISGVAAPFWRAVREHDPDGACYLWLLRYGRCGEHLKIRLHGPRSGRALFASLLANLADAFLSTRKPPDGPLRSTDFASPIDAEDQAEADYLDRTFLWTEYRRSPVSLAGKPFILDDGYSAALTRCHGEACQEVIRAVAPYASGDLPQKLRQTTLLKLLVSGLAALGYSQQICLAYLAYHRDWLLRYLQARSNAELLQPGDFTEVLVHFERRLGSMHPALVALGQTADHAFHAAIGEDPLYLAWQEAIQALHANVVGFRDSPDYHLDSFAADPTFVPIFKVFHGAANQLGLTLPDEAFLHHLLRASISLSADLYASTCGSS